MLSASDPILVLQMAKVASRSWMSLIRAKAPKREVYHFHVTQPQERQRIKSFVTDTSSSQTVKHFTVNNFGQVPDALMPFFENGRWCGGRADIITGVRDPISRALSLVGFLTNRLGYKKYPLTIRDRGTPAALAQFFQEVLACAMSGDFDVPDTLLTYLAKGFVDYGNWFDAQLGDCFMPEGSSKEFNHEGAFGYIRGGDYRAFVYRVEDLHTPQRAASMLDEASRYIGVTLDRFPDAEKTREQRYYKFYEAFKREVNFTSAQLDWFYENETVNVFYSPDEVAAFKAKWSR